MGEGPLGSAVAPAGGERRLRVALAAAPAAAVELSRRIAGGGEALEVIVVGPPEGPFEPPPPGCGVLLLHFDGPAGLGDAVRRHSAAAQVPLIALCERLSPALASAAIEAGACDCLSVGEAASGGIAAAVARALAQAARLEAERRRSRELSAVLERVKGECDAVRAAAITDPTTGLYNKRFFEERLSEEESKVYRTGLPLSLVLVDLDHFKSVNDSFGHEAGDRVLRDFAAILRRCVRNYDIACRHGGDEFGLILPSTRAENGIQVAERLRVEVKAHAFDGLPPGTRITASAGVADLPSLGVTTKEDLLRAADRALYRAKEGGRDRTVTAARGLAPDLASGSAGDLAPAVVLERVERLRTAVRRLSNELVAAHLGAVEALVRLLDEEDRTPIFGRSEATARYAAAIAAALELGADHVERVRRAALFQDLGMVPLASSVEHPGQLDARQRELVHQHPAFSVRIADEIRFFREELPIILHHHEKFDGSGYPRGLRGERIPLGSRILFVATAFGAMTNPRPYRRPLDPAAAVVEIERHSGTFYDPQVVRGFKAALGN